MGAKGFKGPMGTPGVKDFPHWATNIIKFRNDKYYQELGKGCTFDEIDNDYDQIDQSIGKMVNFVCNSLENIPIEEIEKFLRKKKLENINKI